jgi:hypothetical protein
VFSRHRGRLLLTVLLLWTTMLAGTALLGLSGGFLTAAALAGAAGLGNGFNFFSPSAGIRGLTMAEMYLADHIGDSDQQQYESDCMDVQEALATINKIIEGKK